MLTIKDIVSVPKEFITAVQTEYHINDIEKLRQYIPTDRSINIIRNFCINRNGSNVIIGSYGSGKSHLVTLLGNLMSGNYNPENYEILIDRIRYIDEETADLLSKRVNTKSKRFVVLPPYNAEDFEQAILIGLSKALKREGYDFIPIQSSFEKIKKEIDGWKHNFHDTYNKFFNIIEEEYFMSKEQFINGINNFQKAYYRMFLDVYPIVTSGAQFFHYDSSNIIDTISQINREISKFGYDGIDIIFDEFGSFLDNNFVDVNMTLVQELAEFANNHSNNISLYFITHKDLSQYSSRMPDRIVTEWRKVEGRFRRFPLYQKPEDIYKIISDIIIKNEQNFNKFYKKHKSKFEYMYKKTLILPTFKELSSKEIKKYLLKGCFPLAPLSTYVLHKLTDKVAQNNRTLFTYLISDKENSLGRFIETTKKEIWVSGDIIYDYFEESIWGENKESYIYSIWQDTNKAINKVKNDELSTKIVKVIGLIYIINDFDRLKPNIEFISLLLPQYDSKVIENGINDLIDKKVIFYRKIYDVYKFYEGSDLNLESYIDDLIKKNREEIDIIDILNEKFQPSPLIPRRYNDENSINRYLESYFAKPKDLESEKVKKRLSDNFKDGMVYYVIPTSDKEIEELLYNINKFKDLSNLVILLPKKYMDIEEKVLRYWAVSRLLIDEEFLKKEEYVEEELLLYKEELSNEINSILSKNFNNHFHNVYVINKDEVLRYINNRFTLQKEVSKIMRKHFNKTPKINNEMINKNIISSTMKSIERKVINSLWESKYNNRKFKFKKFNAEYTLAKTVFINTKILKVNEEYEVKVNYKNFSKEEPFRLIFEKIESFLEECRMEENNFYELYKVLKEEPFGLKDGVIPLLFSVAIIENLNNIYIRKNGVYKDLDGKLLVNMVKSPKQYLISIDIWDKEKENYILELESIFKDFIDYKYRRKNRLAALYEGVKKYYKSLPKFTRETDLISANAKRMRTVLSNDYNDYKKLFFSTITGGYSYDDTINNVSNAKQEMDEFIDNFKKQYSKKIGTIFKSNGDNLKSSIDNWFKQLDFQIKSHIFDLKTNLFIKYLESPSDAFLDGLIKTLTGFEIEFLSDELAENVVIDLSNIKEKIELIEKEKRDYDNKLYINFNNREKIKYLKNINLSEMGLLLEKKLIKDMENFNYAIDEEEKIYVLIKILDQNI